MSILDLLLETDLEKLQEGSRKDYEVKRLSHKLGKPFVVTCQALTNEQIMHIGEISKNNTDMKLNAILEACRVEKERLSSRQLLDKFKAATPIGLLDKLFLPGEIYELYNVINELSGYSKDAVQEIKN